MPTPDAPGIPFGEWLRAAEVAAGSGGGMDVPCGECRGCCTSAYFIPVGPDETATLERIPRRLLFRAPGRPKGHFLLGYDERGHCAMFRDNGCSIYADRPRACRAYDCRVFAAAGVSEQGKPAIAAQAERWRFAYPSEADLKLHAAVREAARFLRERAAAFPADFVPAHPTQQAALAVRVHAAFLDRPSARDDVAATVEAVLACAGVPRPAPGPRPRGAARPRHPRSG